LKRKKGKKESSLSGVGFKRSQVFLIKYNPHGWRFYQKPGGPELYFLKPELTFTLFFLFFFSRMLLRMVAKVLMETAIKHPQAPQGAKKVVPLFWGKELFLWMRSVVAGLRQSNCHHRRGSTAEVRSET
jgi:hypothetical protein